MEKYSLGHNMNLKLAGNSRDGKAGRKELSRTYLLPKYSSAPDCSNTFPTTRSPEPGFDSSCNV